MVKHAALLQCTWGSPQLNFHALPSYHEFTHGFPQHIQANVGQYLEKDQEHFL